MAPPGRARAEDEGEMIPTWLVQIGSMAGLFTFAFTVFDRLFAGRPIISLSRSE
jgi:hypothetical protein